MAAYSLKTQVRNEVENDSNTKSVKFQIVLLIRKVKLKIRKVKLKIRKVSLEDGDITRDTRTYRL